MTSPHDRALLFSKRLYGGRVAFAHGMQDVPNSAKMFFKPIRAVRIDPFTLHLNVVLVRDGGRFPGSWPSSGDALAAIDAAINWTNRIWSGGLLWLERRHTEIHHAPRTFDIRWPLSRVPREWKRPGTIDVVFVNRIGRRDTVARAWPPVGGDTIVVGRATASGEVSDELMGYHLAREVGRLLGIDRGRPPEDPRNLMYRGAPLSVDPSRIHLLPHQVERVHRTLAGTGERRAVRHN
ncbi:MAG: hypothetical protein R3195_08515 [Gemmatimonadota bacterium]|nr:hypothetical protein [Gemmatimonadota bacterium]